MSLTESVHLHGPSIVEALKSLNYEEINPSTVKNRSKRAEDGLVHHLKIPVSKVNKEVKNLRPCNDNCFHCREWLNFVSKREIFFPLDWIDRDLEDECAENSKTPPEETIHGLRDMFIDSLNVAYKDETIFQQRSETLFKELQSARSDVEQYYSTFMDYYFAKLNLNFEDYSEESSSEFQESYLVGLLEVLDHTERGTFCLNREDFDILKYVTTRVQSNISNPDCNHVSGEAKSPDEIKAAISKYQEFSKTFLPLLNTDWSNIINESWSIAISYLQGFERIYEYRNSYLSNPQNKLSHAYDLSITPERNKSTFSFVWKKLVEDALLLKEQRQKGNSDPYLFLTDHVRALINEVRLNNEHFNQIAHSELELVMKVITLMEEIINRSVNLASSRIDVITKNVKYEEARAKLASPLPTKDSDRYVEHFEGNSPESRCLLLALKKMRFFKEVLFSPSLKACKSSLLEKPDKILEEIQTLLNSVKSNIKDIINEISVKTEANDNNYYGILADWLDPSHDSFQLRIKLGESEKFKKDIWAYELNYSLYRKKLIDRMKNLFPLSKMCDIITKVLSFLIDEGQITLNILSMDSFIRIYDNNFTKLSEERRIIVNDFEVAVGEGREMYAAIIGKLLLKEGIRELENYLSRQKQTQLLENWDVDGESMNESVNSAETKKKKNKKKKKKGGEDTTNSLITSPETGSQPERPVSPIAPLSPPSKPLTALKAPNKDRKLPTMIKTLVIKNEIESKKRVTSMNTTTRPSKITNDSSDLKNSSQVSLLDISSNASEQNNKQDLISKPTIENVDPELESFSQDELSNLISMLEKSKKVVKSNYTPRVSNGTTGNDDSKLSIDSLNQTSYALFTQGQVENATRSNVIRKVFQQALNLKNNTNNLANKPKESSIAQPTSQGNEAGNGDTVAVTNQALLEMIKPALEQKKVFQELAEIYETYDKLKILVSTINEKQEAQEVKILAQSQEITAYRKALLYRDAQLVRLVQQQAYLFNLISMVPSLRERLESVMKSPNHPLNDKLPTKLLQGIDIPGFNIMPEVNGDHAKETPAEPVPTKPKTTKSKSRKAK